MKLGLVLGAGGVVGLAYHSGVLHALEEEGGIRLASADLIVGTSAGAAIAAYLRSGWSTADFWNEALAGRGEDRDGWGDILAPNFDTPLELVQRGVGSAYVLGRSMLRIPVPPVPAVLRRVFPGGLFAMAEGRERLEAELPAAWPSKPLWLCAVDIGSGRRVVLGRDDDPHVDLPRAVQASCAIPGVFPPVRVGDHVLVDGGAHSTTNLDLAASAGCDLIIGVAPLAYDPAGSPGPVMQLARRVPARALAQEAGAARRKGAEVLLLRPTAAEVRAHGINLMRGAGLDRTARDAYEATARSLATDRFRRALAALAA
ncbi:MAG TPA: patatin-like phospholipase family protein [Acidimicrobiales bacterium]